MGWGCYQCLLNLTHGVYLVKGFGVVKKKKYRARYNVGLTNDQAQEIGLELERLFPDGRVDPEKVVSAAKSSRSPLHGFFDWDDATAAHKYRLEQARKIIKAIVVDVRGREVPAYQNVYIEETDSRSYVETAQCLESPDLWTQVLKTALREAEGWSERYRSYEELAPIHVAINQTKQEVLRNV